MVLSAASSVTNPRQKGRNEQDTDKAQGSLGAPAACGNVNGSSWKPKRSCKERHQGKKVGTDNVPSLD